MDLTEKLTLNDRFWEPLLSVFDRSRCTRQCPEYEDVAHLKSDVARVVHSKDSGRGWVQNLRLYCSQLTLSVGNFFDALKSKRRSAFVAEMDDALAERTDARVFEESNFAVTWPYWIVIFTICVCPASYAARDSREETATPTAAHRAMPCVAFFSIPTFLIAVFLTQFLAPLG